MKGKIDGVVAPGPTPDVSVVALTCVVEKATTIEAGECGLPDGGQEARSRASSSCTDEPLVSVDYIGNLLVEHGGRALTKVVNGTLVNVTVLV